MNESVEKIKRYEMFDSMQTMLEKSITEEKINLDNLNDLDKAKSKGIITGAEQGLVTLENIKRGVPGDAALSSLDSRLSHAIYNLIAAEEDYKKNKLGGVRYEIAYYDNLVNSLQLLKERFIVLIDESND